MGTDNEPVPNYTVEKVGLGIIGAILVIIAAVAALDAKTSGAVAFFALGGMCFGGIKSLTSKEQKALQARARGLKAQGQDTPPDSSPDQR
jgi:hypothetical protein